MIDIQETLKSKETQQKEEKHKRIALEFFGLVAQGKFRDGLRFFSPDCKTHNPYFGGSIEALISAMEQANKEGTGKYPNAQFSVQYALADGDLVAVYTTLLDEKTKPSEGGLRQMHLFRFSGDKIVEYWDVTQQVLPNMPNANGAF